jgi:hypothetical protein
MNLTVLDPGSGRAQPGAWVTIYAANTLILTTLYADDDVSTLANPVQANQLGQVAMRVNPGVYDISMSWDGAQPTIVEDVLAWTPEGAVLTTPGDLLVGGVNGSTALHVGQENQLLVVEQGMPAWRHLASNDGAPAGAAGSLMVYGTSGGVQVILPGTQDQALAMAGGMPTWVSTLLPPGTTLPINQPGDLVVGAPGTGLPARLARGNPGDVLTTADTGGLIWTPNSGISRGGNDGVLRLVDANLVLLPLGGKSVWVANQARVIPSAGVGLTPTGLTASTTYFIYAAWVANALTLEASTTGYSDTDGLAHKTGDESRTLVGMARTSALSVWVDDHNHRFVLSYAHGGPIAATGWLLAPRSTSSTTLVEVHEEIRAEFLAFAGSTMVLNLSGMMIAQTAPPVTVNSYIALDGIPTAGHAITITTAGQYINIGLSTVAEGPAGYHGVTLMANVGSGSVAWHGEVTGKQSTRLAAMVSQKA